jgi:HrpA-like RNA helicase
MSATMKEELFAAYFDKCPIVYVSGRMHPVHQHYIAEALEVVAQGQHILAAERGRVSNYNTDAMDDRYDSIFMLQKAQKSSPVKAAGQNTKPLRDPSILG